MKIYTKESLIAELQRIRDIGWIPNARRGNVGGIGNTLEDLLGIEENNLPIPNASEWELKCQRADTTSLITLFHMEPSPRALKFVPRIFLPSYWGFDDLRNKAGTKLLNCFYVQARRKKEQKQEFFAYSDILMLKGFSLEKFLIGIEQGYVYIDFDARTRHNHGTKFRIRQNSFPSLYSKVTEI